MFAAFICIRKMFDLMFDQNVCFLLFETYKQTLVHTSLNYTSKKFSVDVDNFPLHMLQHLKLLCLCYSTQSKSNIKYIKIFNCLCCF